MSKSSLIYKYSYVKMVNSNTLLLLIFTESPRKTKDFEKLGIQTVWNLPVVICVNVKEAYSFSMKDWLLLILVNISLHWKHMYKTLIFFIILDCIGISPGSVHLSCTYPYNRDDLKVYF